jgi:hypothetical protein
MEVIEKALKEAGLFVTVIDDLEEYYVAEHGERDLAQREEAMATTKAKMLATDDPNKFGKTVTLRANNLPWGG